MQNQNPAMTFTEIGQRLGITRQAAEHTFKRALNKIRQNKEAMENFRFLAREHENTRHETWPLDK